MTRGALTLVALLLGASSAALVAAWIVGRRAWPEADGQPVAQIATPLRDVEPWLSSRGDRDVRILVSGDIQHGLSEFADLLDCGMRSRPDVILLLGDLVQKGQPARYAALRQVIREHDNAIPVLAIPGNHDLDDGATLTAYGTWVGPPSWRIVVGDYLVIGLDDASGPVSEESLRLLRAASEELHPTVLVAHRPLAAPPGAAAEEAEALAAKEAKEAEARALQVAEALRRPPTLTICGHVHADADFTDASGTRHLHMGSGPDRSSHEESGPLAAWSLVLGKGPERAERWEVPRRRRLGDEFLRVSMSDVYPLVRARPVLTLTAIACLAFGSVLCMVLAARRRRVADAGASVALG